MALDPKAKFKIVAEDETARAWQSAMTRSKQASAQIGSAIKAAFAGVSVAAIGAAVGQAIAFGDEIGKLSVKTGVGVTAMSELAHAAKMSDVELSSLSTALKKMQINTSEAASGNKQYLQTFAALGIKVSEFRKLGADQQFEAIAEVISRLPDPADRARAATELLGKAGADLLPMFEGGARGIRKAREEAEALGKSLSQDQVKQLQAADSAIKSMKASAEGLAVALATTLGPAISETSDALRRLLGGASQIEILDSKLRILEEARGAIPVFFNFGYLDGGSVVMGPKELDAQIEKIRRELAVLDHTATNAGGPRRGKGNTPPGFGGDKKFVDLSATDRRLETMRVFQENIKELEFAEEMIGSRTKGMWEARQDLMSVLQDGIEDGVKETAGRARDSIGQVGDAIGDAIQKQGEMSVFAEEAARNMQDHFAEFLFDPFEDGLKGMAQGFVDTIRRMLSEAASAKLFETLFGKTGGGGSSGTAGVLTGFLGGLFGGFKAEGGPLTPGKWHIAGEHGPEPIWGGGSGAFAMGYPQGGGGSVTVNMPIDMRGATQDAVKLMMAQQPRMIRQAADLAKAEMRDEQRRGKR